MAIEWIQQRLVDWLGNEFLLEFNWLSLLFSILIPVGITIFYTQIIFPILEELLSFLVQYWPALRPKRVLPTALPDIIAYMQRVSNGFLVVALLSAFYLTSNARSYQQLKGVQLRAERLEKGAVVSQFEALKNQISPHFLFNSLSILTSLVHEDPDLSEQFIKQLSKAYRYILEQRDQELVSLETELEFMESYTFLLKIRFENKFDVVTDVPPAVQRACRIAPLSLQMLIENAVKHNRMSLQEPLLVRIHTAAGHLLVENPVQARDQPAYSTGIGLKNITDRYSLLTKQPVWCGIEQGAFIVKIPLLT